MSLNAVYLVLALVALTTLVGVLWRRRQGTAKVFTASHEAQGAGEASAAESTKSTIIRSADLGVDENTTPFGYAATLLQFSTDFCSSCPATRRMLGGIAAGIDGVEHVDIDLTHRGDLANRYRILQTPTTFILDGSGALIARIGGAARRDVVEHQLDSIVGARS